MVKVVCGSFCIALITL
ncbi:hypothetical protein Q4579_15285 [Photobacterium sp. 1_MG-2023]|nr:hypothetical protein [Photobacterium sp. 1_MG-2023]MDO6707589.1 hypothetical protein [Photobacterium sp. 1_MG-2023]